MLIYLLERTKLSILFPHRIVKKSYILLSCIIEQKYIIFQLSKKENKLPPFRRVHLKLYNCGLTEQW